MNRYFILYWLLLLSISLIAQPECRDRDDPFSGPNYDWSYDVHRFECAWDITEGSEDVIVAVVDNFSPISHPDLAGKIAYVSPEFPPYSDWNCHHGLRISGIIAAIPDNGICHAGTGYNTRLAIYNALVNDNNCTAGSGNGSPAPAIRQVISDGYKIMMASWSDVPITRSEIEEYIEDGGVIIAPACSNGHSKADIDGYIVVGSMSFDGSKWIHTDASCSNNRNTDIYIYTPVGQLSANGQCSHGPSGTSGCAPQVAGIVALMRDVNPCISGAAIEQILKQTAQGFVHNVPAGNFDQYLDAEAAVAMAATYVPNDYVLSSPIVISDLSVDGNIILNAGADVTVTGTIKMGHEKRIVVRRGARLHVNGGEITNNFCGEDWKGIFVEGKYGVYDDDINGQLGFPFGALDPNKAGELLVTNGGTIRNARFGADLTGWWEDYQWPLSKDYQGGYLYADNANFINCKVRAILFPGYFNEKSVIKNSLFDGNTDAIQMWSNSGAIITGNTFVNQERRDITVLNSGPQIIDQNIFQDDDPDLFEFPQIAVLNTHPNAQYTPVIGDDQTLPNEFNDFGEAIRLEGVASDRPIEIRNNTFNSGLAGVLVIGKNRYSLDGNNFSGNQTGIVSFNTGDDQNFIRQNFFNSNRKGINILEKNDRLKFPENCIQNSTSAGIQLDRYLVDPTVNYVQDGLGAGDPSDNCFELNGNSDFTGNFTDVFVYMVDDQLPLSDCRIPNLSGSLFSFIPSDVPSNGIVCQNEVSNSNTNELPVDLSDLITLRNILLADLSNLQNISNPSHFDKNAIAIITNRIERVEIAMINLYVKNNQQSDATNLAYNGISEDVRLGLYGALLNYGLFSNARLFLNSLNSSEAGWLDFVQVQNLWITKLEQGERTASESEKTMLFSLGSTVNKYAAWTRGVYMALTGDMIRLPSEETVLLRYRGQEAIEPSGLSIFPNPANTNITIVFKREVMSEGLTLNLYDVNGQKIRSNRYNTEEVRYNLDHLSSGIYWIEILYNDGDRDIEKLIISE